MKIKINSIGYRKNTILKNLFFDLKDGQVLGLIAPNGKGKSTLFKGMMNRLSHNDTEMMIDGYVFNLPVDLKDEPLLYQLISIMPEQQTLMDHISGIDHLKFVKQAWSSKKEIKDIVEMLDMIQYVHKKVSGYSLGMRQRLCFAMQIMMDTRVMLMDEVMNSLDIMNVELISKIINDLKKQDKIIIIASHLLENLIQYSDKVLFILDPDQFMKFDLNKEMPRYLKVQLSKNVDDDFYLKLKQDDDFKDILPNLFIKESEKVSVDELKVLLDNPFISSVSISPKTLTEMYYEFYIVK